MKNEGGKLQEENEKLSVACKRLGVLASTHAHEVLRLEQENEKLRSELESANNNMLCMRQEVEDVVKGVAILKAKLDQSAAALSWIGSAINGTHPELAKSDLRRTPVYEDALALKAENEKLRSELESANNNMLCMRQEVEDLRAVFEAARRALRYCGVWKVKFNEAMSQLYLACEAVKAADAGNGDEM